MITLSSLLGTAMAYIGPGVGGASHWYDGTWSKAALAAVGLLALLLFYGWSQEAKK